MEAWCTTSVILNFYKSTAVWKGIQFLFFFFSQSQLYYIFWLSFYVFPLFMEHIEVDVASATFFLFKVLCRGRNGEIVCLQIPAAPFSAHYAFPHFPPVNKLWTSKVVLHWGDTSEGWNMPLLIWLYREREREKGRETMSGLTFLKYSIWWVESF